MIKNVQIRGQSRATGDEFVLRDLKCSWRHSLHLTGWLALDGCQGLEVGLLGG